ncbi:MAG: hypothetical protein ACI9CB_002181 [Rhodothermales bacterium]
MSGFTFRAAVFSAMVLMLAGCAALDEILHVVVEAPSIENQRAAIAMSSLDDLKEIDTYIRLNNKPLGDQISGELEAQALVTDLFKFSKLRVRFARQYIALEGTLQIANGEVENLTASVHGDVILTFSGARLIWLPRFDELKLSDTEFNYKGKFYPIATDELEAGLLRMANMDIADAVIVLGKNMANINPLPLGKIEVGAALTNFKDVSSSGSHDLGGVFTVVGSTVLIEPALTSIALDLEFIPNISECPSDVYVSRSTFTNEIRNREPVGIERLLNEGENESHFFTEISGATRSTSIIHYWFADGEPVALEELQVEPSFRWRTWSTKRIDHNRARNWEVIVVEKETGCILHSQAIHSDPAINRATDDPTTLRLAYDQLQTEFENRVSGFSILQERPDIALIEVPRAFLTEVLHASLKDIHIVVNFDLESLAIDKLQGQLLPFSADDIFCEERECTSQQQCISGFTQCARHRDSRDCTRCLFRNPLNNRCLNEGTDPICEAAKVAQNNRHDANRNSCQEQERVDHENCQRLVAQQLQSCEIETESEKSACDAVRETVREFSDTQAFADVELQIESSGGLSSIFSGFEIDGDLENIRLKLGFAGAMYLNGSIRFSPTQNLGPLTSCMSAWQKSFEAKVVMPYLGSSMIGTIDSGKSYLVTDWSGYVVTAPITPTPLQAMFVDNPNLLADCQIGLTVDKVARAIEGAASDYLDGNYMFEIQPLPSRISLAQATVEYGEMMYMAEPELSSAFLKYEVNK